MSKGIVVQHKDSNVRYAVSEENHDEASELFIRDLKPGETILGYIPKEAPKKGESDPELDEATAPEEELKAPAISDTEQPANPPTTEAGPSGSAKTK